MRATLARSALITSACQTQFSQRRLEYPMDELVRPREINASVIRKARAMTPAESIALAASLTDAAIELSKGIARREAALFAPSTKSTFDHRD